MASASDWWQRALGRAPQPPAPSPGTLPTGVRPPSYAPAPMAPSPAAPAPPQGYYSYDANTGAQVADDGHVAMLITAAEQTGGSKKVRENTGTCPECGSGNYFARKFTENGMPMRMEAAPRCYDCGYPVVQAGSSRGGASSARQSGPAHRARQLPSSHAVVVIDGGNTMTYPPNG